MSILSPKEKLARMLKPTCVEDYGLSLSLEDITSFKEGFDWLNLNISKIERNNMKLYADRETGALYGDVGELVLKQAIVKFVGEIEVKKPKKAVVKEIELPNACPMHWHSHYGTAGVTIPPNAKNIKLTYEVEE